LKAGHMHMGQYRAVALAFNQAVAAHNKRCPKNPVAPLLIGPQRFNE
jgi:hypothetical protein